MTRQTDLMGGEEGNHSMGGEQWGGSPPPKLSGMKIFAFLPSSSSSVSEESETLAASRVIAHRPLII